MLPPMFLEFTGEVEAKDLAQFLNKLGKRIMKITFLFLYKFYMLCVNYLVNMYST